MRGLSSARMRHSEGWRTRQAKGAELLHCVQLASHVHVLSVLQAAQASLPLGMLAKKLPQETAGSCG